MKTLEQIFEADREISKIIKDLKQKNIKVKPWEELQKEYEPIKHKIITDPNILPDKPIYDEAGTLLRMEKATKIAIGLQKLAVKRIAEFMFTIPVGLSCEESKEDDIVEFQFKALKKILKRNRWGALNKRRCRANSSQCEQAVYWYLVKTNSEHKDYGFKAKHKLKCQLFSPENGDLLYPLFDKTGDMVAFSRETSIQVSEDKKVTYFDCWTADNYYQWKKTDSENWEVSINKTKSDIGKIPIVYGYRDKPIWDDADTGKVHEMEMLLSRNGEVIAYHSSPVLVISGELQGAPTKGEANKVFYSKDGNGKAEYAYWPQSPESVKFQFETLRAQFFAELQLPDLSLENIKGLGATSGEARKWLLADAHLKVGDESEIYTDIIDRDFNVVKAFLGVMNPEWKSSIGELEVDAEIKPFTIQSRKEEIEVVVAANGGKPVVSQKTSVELSGLVDDPGAEFEQIQAEAEEENQMSLFQPTA